MIVDNKIFMLDVCQIINKLIKTSTVFWKDFIYLPK